MRTISLNDIFELLTVIGFIYFLIKRFILKEAPIPSSALKKADRNQILASIRLLQKSKPVKGKPYHMTESLERKLLNDLHNPDNLKELLLHIAAHVGIDGQYIRLNFQDDETAGYAGNIATNGAWTTINLQIHSYYNPDVLTAVLAHEVMHLYLYYNGIQFQDTLSNEILTDTAAVYFGFGDYLYRGYRMIETQLGFSYHKVGYIRPEDVLFIQEQCR